MRSDFETVSMIFPRVFGGPNECVIAAIYRAKRARLGDFVCEAHAQRTHDAPLVVEHDAIGQRIKLGRVRLWITRQRFFAVVRKVIVLQRTLARLVADAAVDRMVERDELHGLLAEFF